MPAISNENHIELINLFLRPINIRVYAMDSHLRKDDGSGFFRFDLSERAVGKHFTGTSADIGTLVAPLTPKELSFLNISKRDIDEYFKTVMYSWLNEGYHIDKTYFLGGYIKQRKFPRYYIANIDSSTGVRIFEPKLITNQSEISDYCSSHNISLTQ